MRDLDAEQVAQLHEHLVHRLVPLSLADAIDARCEDFRTGPEGHDRVPGAEPEVVVEMDDQWRVGGGRLDLRNVLAHGERRVAADRVRRRGPGATGLQAFAVDLTYVVDVGAAAVLASELDGCGPLRTRVANRIAHHPQVRLAVARHRQLQPFGFGNAIAMPQRLAELVLDVQVRG